MSRELETLIHKIENSEIYSISESLLKKKKVLHPSIFDFHQVFISNYQQKNNGN